MCRHHKRIGFPPFYPGKLVFLALLTSVRCVPAPIPTHVAATVNGEPILKSEVNRQREAAPGELPPSAEASLKRLILFRLAVQEAKQQKLDADPKVRHELDRVLYQSFVEHELKKAKLSLEPTPAELSAFYENHAPLLRLRHLVLPAGTAAAKEEALQVIKGIRARLASGHEFKGLVLEHSRDASVRLGGDLDFRGIDSLPTELYLPAQKLKPMEVSAPIELGDALHLIQLTDRKRFADAPAT